MRARLSFSRYLDVVRLQVIDGLLILLCDAAAGGAAHKVLPRAAEAVAEAGLPHCVVVHPLTAALL